MTSFPPASLAVKDAGLLLANPYLPMEAGVAYAEDGICHIAASTYMKGSTGAMIDWWFGWIHSTEQYKIWHPRDHVFSDWEGPRENNSTYIGGHHLVHEYIGGELQKLKISFKDPSEYFGSNWKDAFKEAGYSTAVCGRTGMWDDETGNVVYVGHLIHLIKDEPDGVRMRSRFWLGDVEGITDPEIRKTNVPQKFAMGLMQHATEEMAILATVLPELYAKYSKDSGEKL
ncbi:hypothetical protein N7448_000947 [Penicillium atrosanguineum]|uniref:DAPG hydrolase PhiG domain-containing protein n=1 Tax=Penicillium atrosanguineum TaxID=1132637 RepID=A0A9W9LD34_9EURO|nr:uncharacterized protein N7443_004343 [Penicillium atrosanguineum]KAJ5134031.1 hypothetical protein N7526_005396 [Penicillium atrosanguineum]KAJ5149369.1 hypothetical protein N7448_000947 [Penicillium atrosanguineum]KAJ5304683.1 hypothetical protein N7443_004343 [Penicillium atrosanguineum]KAJ5324148.1 hypothetical protein N7476_002748 [Penicillium atrosanguineum]